MCAFKQGRLHSPLKKSAGRSEEVDANGRVCSYTLPQKEETPEIDVEPGAISQETPEIDVEPGAISQETPEFEVEPGAIKNRRN